MKPSEKYIQSLLGMLCLFSAGVVSAAGMNPCATPNPCAMKNPCATPNPCAMKNPCATPNPCAMKNPCAMRNPCAAKVKRFDIDATKVLRPAGTRLAAGNHNELVREGKVLWNDTKLSSNGMSCNTCHQNNSAFGASFAKPYPHKVGMVQERSGISKVHLDEMVQFCMLAPMAAKPFPWDSRELAALTVYAAEVQKTYKAGSGATMKPQNPCGAMKNPCAMQGNPCAMRH